MKNLKDIAAPTIAQMRAHDLGDNRHATVTAYDVYGGLLTLRVSRTEAGRKNAADFDAKSAAFNLERYNLTNWRSRSAASVRRALNELSRWGYVQKTGLSKKTYRVRTREERAAWLDETENAETIANAKHAYADKLEALLGDDAEVLSLGSRGGYRITVTPDQAARIERALRRYR